MYEDEKIYVIDLGDELETPSPAKEPRAVARAVVKTPQHNPRLASELASTVKAVRAASATKKLGPVQIALLVGLAYLLGPFALLLTPKGRENSGWLTAGIASGIAGVALLLWGHNVPQQLGGGWSFLLLAVVVSLVVLTWFAAWSRAVYFAGTAWKRNSTQLPEWIDRPWSVGSLGFLIPGMGLLVAGCPRRAATVVLALGPAMLAGLLLLNASWIWNLHMATGWRPLSSHSLEGLFIMAAVIVFAALLGWSAQALEGIRQVHLQRRTFARGRGDWYAVALLATAATLVVVANPGQLAGHLDRQVDHLRGDGYQVIPLYMTLAASKLDPSQSQYAVKAMDLYSELGQAEKAAQLRYALDRNLDTYVQYVRGTRPLPEEPLLAARPAPAPSVTRAEQPAEDFIGPVFYGTLAPREGQSRTAEGERTAH